MIMKKCMIIICMSVVMLFTNPLILNAQEPATFTAEEDDGYMRADVIVTKFRVLNGKVQYRRWNETRGYWVDPDWIDL